MSEAQPNDRQAITDLIYRYCLHVDQYEPDKVATLFLDDCVVDYGPGMGGPMEGPAAVEKALAQGLRFFEATHHQVSNILLDFETADRATGITYVTAWHRPPGDAPHAIVWARYDDVFERRDGAWGFAERKILVAGQAGFHVDWNPIPRHTP